MRNFSRDNKSGGWRRDKKFRGRYSDKPTMYKAVCDECGKACEVPFKPTGDKPVYCSECFEKKGNVSSRRGGKRDSRRSSYGDKRMYKAICDECGKECEVPFRPTSGKPVFCSECFEKKGGKTSRTDRSKVDFEVLNTKLDKILKILSPSVSKKVVQKKETVKKKKVSKPKKVTKKKTEKSTVKKTIKKKAISKKRAAKKKK
jgi:CxxC-x17-CxxC domain-containing protein